MPNQIKSFWTINLAGLELVAEGDLIVSDPSVSQSHEVSVKPLLRAAAPSIVDYGNVVETISITRIYEFDHPSALRIFTQTHRAATAALRDGQLTMSLAGGETDTYPQAALQRVDIRYDENLNTRNKVEVSYEIVASRRPSN